MKVRGNVPSTPTLDFVLRETVGDEGWIAGVKGFSPSLASGKTPNEAMDRARAFFAKSYRWSSLEGRWVHRWYTS